MTASPATGSPQRATFTTPRVARWCQQRIPAHARHQVRLEHQTHGHTVTIVERRAPWDPDHGPEWTSRPIAQLRHSTHGWRLYWADSNSRWHLTHDVPTATNVAPLLIIEQAKGVIAERHGIDPGQAFTLLRAYARDHGQRLTELAAAVIEGSTTVLPAPPAPTPRK